MEFAKKIFDCIKIYIIKYYIAFFCGGVVWMLLDVLVTKGIDASFVSAVMDFSLVIFAVLAFTQARKIWVDRAKQDGYKIALDLLNNKFIETTNQICLNRLLSRNEKVLKAYLLLLNDYSGVNSEVLKEDEYIDILKAHCSEFYKHLKSFLSPLAKEIKLDLFRMRNMAVIFNLNSNGSTLKKHFEDFVILDEELSRYYDVLKGAVFFHDENIISSDIDELAKTLENLILYNLKIKRLMSEMQGNYNVILNDESVSLIRFFKF